LDLLEALLTRRAIWRYTDQPVPPDLLDRLLEAATWVPSSHERQPWRVVVLTLQDIKVRLAEMIDGSLVIEDG
jgi:nitroreductase